MYVDRKLINKKAQKLTLVRSEYLHIIHLFVKITIIINVSTFIELSSVFSNFDVKIWKYVKTEMLRFINIYASILYTKIMDIIINVRYEISTDILKEV